MLAGLVDVFGEFDGRMGKVLPFQQPLPGVVIDPDILSGHPVIKGTRIGYDQVAALLADDVRPEDIALFFPSVTAEAALAAQRFADYVNKFDLHEQPGRAAG